MQLQSHTQLEDMVYQCVSQYMVLRQATSAGLELIDEIERTKRSFPLPTEEQEALIQQLTQRAWTRIAAEQPDMFELYRPTATEV